MEISVQDRGEVRVLELAGRFDASVVSEFKQAVQKGEKEGLQRFIIDLSALTFLDSSGLGALVASLRGIAQNGGDMRLAAPGPEVQALLELTRLDRVFDIYPDVDGAV